ncbi:MAG: cytochrome c oxidase subunit II [Cyanobacteria bacterium]|nr:cytochrome c oxidase subunit II [Cyanobacteriota bacterium]
MNVPSQIITLLFGIGLTLVSLWYGYNHHLLPLAASKEAVLIDDLFNVMMVISTGIFILVQGAILFIAFRYQRQEGDETDAKYVHGNIPLEIVWTAIPSVIVLALSLYSFDIYEQIGGLNPMDHSSHQGVHQEISNKKQKTPSNGIQEVAVMDAEMPGMAKPLAADDSAVTINVSGMQFAWLFNYAGTEVTTGELHLPVGRDIILNLTAMDVLHAFWVPEFRIKQDAVPGRTIPIRISPTVEGTYPLICAELCGAYHGVMRSEVVVQSERDYNIWLAEQAVAMKEQNHNADSKNPVSTVALYPELLSDTEYLAPYAKKLGVTVEHIQAIQAQQQS